VIDAPVAELREVRGPSALGGGRKRFLELLWLVASTDFRKTYFGTVLGYVWSLLRPLLLFAVLLLVFTKIIRVGSSVPHYPELLLFGIVLFSFFQEATMNALSSVVGREGIVRKTQFPRLVIPLATVVTSLLNLGMNMIVVLAFLLASGVNPMWTWLLFPVIVVALLVLTTAVSMLLSTLYVRYRDVGVIWGVMATALFYATPVLYPWETVEQHASTTVQHLIFLNPLTPIFVQARKWIVDPNAPGAVSAAGGWVYLIPPLVIFVAVCGLAIWKFSHDAPHIAEAL
jgi:ABC-2 type transport system permease protein